MILVLGLAGLIWWGGRLMGLTRPLRLSLLGLLMAMVLLIQLTLPDGAPLREATGGTAALWLILLGVGVLVALYAFVLKRLKARADQGADAAEAETPAAPFTDTELNRYARHIVLREIGGLGQKRLKEARVLVIGAGGLGRLPCNIWPRRVSAPSG